jgi:hypothetical protein
MGMHGASDWVIVAVVFSILAGLFVGYWRGNVWAGAATTVVSSLGLGAILITVAAVAMLYQTGYPDRLWGQIVMAWRGFPEVMGVLVLIISTALLFAFIEIIARRQYVRLAVILVLLVGAVAYALYESQTVIVFDDGRVGVITGDSF